MTERYGRKGDGGMGNMEGKVTGGKMMVEYGIKFYGIIPRKWNLGLRGEMEGEVMEEDGRRCNAGRWKRGDGG